MLEKSDVFGFIKVSVLSLFICLGKHFYCRFQYFNVLSCQRTKSTSTLTNNLSNKGNLLALNWNGYLVFSTRHWLPNKLMPLLSSKFSRNQFNFHNNSHSQLSCYDEHLFTQIVHQSHSNQLIQFLNQSYHFTPFSIITPSHTSTHLIITLELQLARKIFFLHHIPPFTFFPSHSWAYD